MPILGHGSAGFLADDDGVLSPTASSARELRQSKQNQIPENPHQQLEIFSRRLLGGHSRRNEHAAKTANNR
jgi:hypothetical protein